MSKPWKMLRCVVEAKVPPGNRSNEKDLIYQVEQALKSGHLPMPRDNRPDLHWARPTVKSFTRVFVAERKVFNEGAKKIHVEMGERPLTKFERMVLFGLWAIVRMMVTPRQLSKATMLQEWFKDVREILR